MGDITSDPSGKYLLLEVPDFSKDPVKEPSRVTDPSNTGLNHPPSAGNGKPMTSFLRLGAASGGGDAPIDPGYDLLRLIPQTGPLANNATNNEIGSSPQTTFKGPQRFDDDVREIWGPNHGLVGGALAGESAALFTRGGWRDHTDGNRLTTTRGDKVEVIRGNYKMVVLGRSDDPQGAVGWELTNQNLVDFGNGATPGSSVETRYREDKYGGCWELINLVAGYVTHTSTWADQFEYTYGDHIESTIGSETPGSGDSYKAKKNWDGSGFESPGPNPDIVEKTWAKTLTSYTGSAKLPVNVISEETFAVEMSSVTNAVNIVEATTAAMISSTTTAAAAINEATNAMAINSVTTVGGAISEQTQAAIINGQVVSNVITNTTTVAGAINEMTNAATINEVVNAGSIASMTVAGAVTSVDVVGAATSISAVGQELELKVADAVESLVVGSAELDLKLIPLIIDVLVGMQLNLFVGGKVDVNLSAAVEFSLAKWEFKKGAFHQAGCVMFSGED